MANYKETSLEGTSYVRAANVSLINGLTNKSITFNEEKIINLSDGDVIRKSGGSVSDEFTAENAPTSFDLLHPDTGDVVGSATYQDVYVMLYSLYINLATKRDSGV